MTQIRISISTKHGLRCAVATATIAAAAFTGGCAAETGGWPKMTDFSRISQKILSPQEQDQAVKNMSAEQQAEQAKALEKIEKNK